MDGCLSIPFYCWVSASTSDFLSLYGSLGTPLLLGPSFHLISLEWRLFLRASPFPVPCFENHLCPLICLPSPSTVAAAQMTPGEKSIPPPLCSTTSGPASIPKLWPLNPESHFSSSSWSHQRIHSPLWVPTSPSSSPN